MTNGKYDNAMQHDGQIIHFLLSEKRFGRMETILYHAVIQQKAIDCRYRE